MKLTINNAYRKPLYRHIKPFKFVTVGQCSISRLVLTYFEATAVSINYSHIQFTISCRLSTGTINVLFQLLFHSDVKEVKIDI